MEPYDIAVIGGGASGLAAAVSAADRIAPGGRAAILEKNPRVGKKLLATGNGRCNLTNRNADAAAYRGDSAFLTQILNRYPPRKILDCFSGMGLVCRELDGGRIYPYSLQASSVLNVLRRRLERSRVETLCGFSVQTIRAGSSGFTIFAQDGRAAAARRIILAAGGSACPQSGSCGDGCGLARSFGHSVTELSPALVPVKTDPALVKPLRGLRFPARAVLNTNGKALAESSGEVQFTENALSGICIFDLSRYVSRAKDSRKAEIVLDLIPEYPAERAAEYLIRTARRDRTLSCAELAGGIFGKALGTELARRAFAGRVSGSAAESDPALLARTAKRLSFPVRGTFGWDRAQVTAGGVPLCEVDPDMQSRFQPGLFLCGELLDADGICGGYNLHWAWSTGFAAGAAAARSLTGNKAE